MAIINNLNGDKVEFTGVSRVWNNTKYDFEEIYFGDKQIFSIWAELESPLPITILAAGEDLIDYRIYGNTVGGESVGERTENIIPLIPNDWESGGILNGGTRIDNNTRCRTKGKVSIKPGTTYTLMRVDSASPAFNIYIAYHLWGDNDRYIADSGWKGSFPYTFTNPSDARYIEFTCAFSYSDLVESGVRFTLTEGSTAPTSYIPYGYKLPMVVTNGTTTTTTPIYIGSDPLAEDEYVDFGEQKVYRRTENLWNPNTAEKKRIVFNGAITNDNNYALNTIPVESVLNYVFYSAEALSNVETLYQFRDDNDEIVGSARNSRGIQRALFTVPENATKVLMCFSLAWEDGIIRDFGVYQMDTLPSEYIPYIAPTDPPAPIPALPTVEGETIIDYNPSETPAVEPEKMYTKYRKEGF